MSIVMGDVRDATMDSVTEMKDDEPWQEKAALRSGSTKKKLLKMICHSSSIFLSLALISFVPSKYNGRRRTSHSVSVLVLQVLVGCRYSNACPINPLIPHYLIVGGLVGLVLIILAAAAQLMTRKWARTMIDDVLEATQPPRANMFIGCGICSIMCISLSLVIFLLGWFVAGWIWVLDAWRRVQYEREKETNYCHPILYQSAFLFLVISTMLQTLFVYVIGRKRRVNMESLRNKESATDEET
jgi:hypothetical protein